jgi:alpha-L-rhamnosidase
VTEHQDGRDESETAGFSRRRFLGTTGTVGAAAAVGLRPGTAVAADPPALPAPGPLVIGRLTTAYAERLLGTDVAHPRFSWVLAAAGYNARQAAYQVEVSTSGAVVWDSGRAESDRSVGVPYDGPELAPRTRYDWRVRVWDPDGRGSGWSERTWFETAMTDPADWAAAWIGLPPSQLPPLTLAGASWIWSADATTQTAPLGARYLRGRFRLPASIASARLVATADDDFTLWLDGDQTLSAPQQVDGWRSARAVDVTDRLQPHAGADVVLAALATNRPPQTVNPAGFIAKLLVTTTDGDVVSFVTDGSWRVAASVPDGWESPAFDDSGWAAAKAIAPYGQGPWGSGVTIPPTDTSEVGVVGASWIWSSDATTQNAPVGTRWFRGRLPVPAGVTVTSARLVFTADDDFTLWLDGAQTLDVPQQTDAWRIARVADVTDQVAGLGGRDAVLAVRATNRPGASVNPGGLLGKLVVTLDSGQALTLVTDASWLVSEAAPDGWQLPGFDDASWVHALVLAPYGQGPWGSGVGLPAPEQPAPLLRKAFHLDKPVRRARLYATGLAYQELWLDGSRVGRAVLDPGFTDYDETVLYTTYDVTDALGTGDHVLGAELGRGFYGMTTPNVWRWHQTPWHGDPRLLLQLVVDHTDGTTTTVVTDRSWKVVEGPTRSDSLYSGETYDARKEQKGWAAVGFDDAPWTDAARLPAPKGALAAQQHEPVTVLDDVPVARWTSPSDGVWVADFGRTMAGWARLRVDLPEATVVGLLFGEKVDGAGRVVASNGNVQSPRFQYDEYVSDGSPGDWEARFSYKGFRYVQVTGLVAAPDAATLTARVVGSEVARVSQFACSDPDFERFEAMMSRTIRNNLHGIPTDTPMYEKNGWTGDAQVGSTTMALTFDMARFFTKWVGDMADSQVGSGQVPVIIPSGGWGYTELAPSPEWTTVFPFVVREMYRWYGDTRLAARHWAALARYLDWELGRLQDGLAVTALGDYLSPGTGGNPPEDTRLTATAFLVRGLRHAAEVGDLVGEGTDAARFRTAADSLVDRLNETFLDRANGYYRTAKDPGYRQTSNAVPLAFGLVPDGYVRPVVESLVADVRSRGMHLNTGCLGTEVLLPVLTDHGYADVALAVARQTTYPSWGFWLDNGADTMWEFWTADTRSRDHYFQGTVAEWLVRDVAGLRPGDDGWRTLVVRAGAHAGLTSARYSLQTVRGRAAVDWSRSGRTMQLDVVVPVGSDAEVHVPAAGPADVTVAPAAGLVPVRTEPGFVVYAVGSGAWQFVSRSAV